MLLYRVSRGSNWLPCALYPSEAEIIYLYVIHMHDHIIVSFVINSLLVLNNSSDSSPR
jgi:hypothetical protein